MQKNVSATKIEATISGLDEIDDFRKFLGQTAREFNDAQIRQLRREMFGMAELLLDFYLLRKRDHARKEKEPGDFDRSTSQS